MSIFLCINLCFLMQKYSVKRILNYFSEECLFYSCCSRNMNYADHWSCTIKNLLWKISHENFSIFKRKTCGKFLNKVACSLQLYLKRQSDTGIFLGILRRFWEHLFFRTTCERLLLFLVMLPMIQNNYF